MNTWLTFYALWLHWGCVLCDCTLMFRAFDCIDCDWLIALMFQALYANISLLEHSCINNASKHFDGDFRWKIVILMNTSKAPLWSWCWSFWWIHPRSWKCKDCEPLILTRVVIRAAVNIKKGEHISINYSDPMWGTCNRQIHLGERLFVYVGRFFCWSS